MSLGIAIWLLIKKIKVRYPSSFPTHIIYCLLKNLSYLKDENPDAAMLKEILEASKVCQTCYFTYTDLVALHRSFHSYNR